MKTKVKKVEGSGFVFQPIGHKYFLDGRPLTGVTTILGVIAKPVLIQWAANQAVDYIKEKVISISTEVNSKVPDFNKVLLGEWDIIMKDARSAHRKKKEAAGEAGTDVHALIEQIIKDSIAMNKGFVVASPKGTVIFKDNPQVQHFIDWAVNNHVKFLASEEKVYSKELFVAGTIDFICEIEGEVWIGDIKTSSAIYPEHFFQTAGYQRLLKDMGKEYEVKGHVILNCRKDGTFEEKRSISNEDNLLAFMSALNLYRITEKLKGNII